MTEPSEIAKECAEDYCRLRGIGPSEVHQMARYFQSAIDKATAGMVKREDVLPLVEALERIKDNMQHNPQKRLGIIELDAVSALDHAKAKGLV